MEKEYKFRNAVIVTDFDVPFRRMVELMVKAVLATVPAMFILAIIGVFFYISVLFLSGIR